MSFAGNRKNLLKRLINREVQDSDCLRFQRSLHVSRNWVSRLNLEVELEGHGGCVNCLEWNTQGSLLASGSDDLQAIIWDPLKHQKLCSVSTGHQGNIFSVKFLPQSNDNQLVTGAADFKIGYHDIENKELLQTFTCHAGRVKRLATAPNIPNMFWSAGEDGTIRQFDLRSPHSCSDQCDNVLINLNSYLGKSAEAKCIAINPLRPEQMAVGANDCFVRLYDTRMLTPHSVRFSSEERLFRWHSHPYPDPKGILPQGCVQYFVPGHLPVRSPNSKRFKTIATTYLTFSPSGNELLVNLGGEQVYLFDVAHKRKSRLFTIADHFPPTNGVSIKVDPLSAVGASLSSKSANGFSTHLVAPVSSDIHRARPYKPSKTLPVHIEEIKQKANEMFNQKDYTSAIACYNKAVSLEKHSPILYSNRAAAFMKRKWDGDLYAALRDCHEALTLDPGHCKAHFRLAKCLHELSWSQEANDCLKVFKEKYPEQAGNYSFESLDREIADTLLHNQQQQNQTDKGDSRKPGRKGRGGRGETLPEEEKDLRDDTYDYELRFCGHCNTTTDIKEANFFGSNGQYIVAGSDDGSFFMWEAETTNLVRVLRGDESIVNCLQAHPTYCLLASSGIDPVIRLWSVQPETGLKDDRNVAERDTVASANQRRMNADPLVVMLSNMGYHINMEGDGPASSDTLGYHINLEDQEGEGGEEQEGEGEPMPLQCRPS